MGKPDSLQIKQVNIERVVYDRRHDVLEKWLENWDYRPAFYLFVSIVLHIKQKTFGVP